MPKIQFTAAPLDPKKQTSYLIGLEQPVTTEEQGIQLANRFGIRVGKDHHRLAGRDLARVVGTIVHARLTTTYSYQSRSLVFHAASGGLRYRDYGRWGVDTGKAVTYDDNEAIGAAREFAEKMQFLPSKEYRVSKVKHLHKGTSDLQKNIQESRKVNTAVVFQRYIGRVPVEGPGGKLVVFLDPEAAVVGCDRTWRTFSLERKRLTDFHDKAALARIFEEHFEHAPNAEVEVVDSRFAYYELGPDAVQQQLQPVHLFYYNVKGPFSPMRAVRVVPASPHAAAGFEHLAGEVTVQAPRK